MFKIAVLAGDGIGPEVMTQAIKVLRKIEVKYKIEFDLQSADVGGVAIDKHDDPLPGTTLRICESSDCILFGSVGGPKWESLQPEKQPERGALLPLRKHFRLSTNIRPIKIFPILKDICPLKKDLLADSVDILIFRELTGGIYFGEPKYISDDGTYAVDTMKYEKKEIENIARLAFETANGRWGQVTLIDKANVLMTSMLWRRIVQNLWENEYNSIKLNYMYVDNAAMQLIKNPAQFDVILTSNLFGDILSDEASVLAGSLGMLPSASLNKENFGLYEPIGGSAPDIAEKNIANPIAQILCVSQMLKYSFKMNKAALEIENAVETVLNKGYRTKDISLEDTDKIVGTEEMGELICLQI